MSISGLRLLSTNDSIVIDTEVADHRGFLALNVTANVINLTVTVVATADQSAKVAAEISDRFLTPLRRWA